MKYLAVIPRSEDQKIIEPVYFPCGKKNDGKLPKLLARLLLIAFSVAGETNFRMFDLGEKNAH